MSGVDPLDDYRIIEGQIDQIEHRAAGSSDQLRQLGYKICELFLSLFFSLSNDCMPVVQQFLSPFSFFFLSLYSVKTTERQTR